MNFALNYTNRVSIKPKVTLGDGSEAVDYCERMVMEVKGSSGDLSATIGNWVNFADPSTKTAGDYAAWSSISANPRPGWVTSAMESFSGSVTAGIVSNIEGQINASVSESVPEWAS